MPFSISFRAFFFFTNTVLIRNTDFSVYFSSIQGRTFLPLYLTDFIQIKCKEDAKMSFLIGAIGNIGSDLILEIIRRR